jgi:hypothetical protein
VRGGARGAMALLACVVSMGFPVSSAQAAVVHSFDHAFGPDGTSSTAFGRPAALAVDQSTGVVYLADLAVNKLYRFDSANQPADFSALGSNEIGGFSFNSEGGVSQLAVNSTSGVLYVVDNFANKVKAFKANGEPAEFSTLGSSELGGFGELCGVAVDQNGAIYAGDYGASAVKVYTPSGEFVVSLNTPEPCNVAVDSHGSVYVNRWHSSVSKYGPSAFPVTSSTTYASAGVIDSNNSFGLAVDPDTDDVYIDEGARVVRYDETGSSIEVLGASGEGAVSESEGLAIDPSGNVYISDAGGAHRVGVFIAVHVPSVTTGTASGLTRTSATVAGTVSADSTDPAEALTECKFEYGTTVGYGQTAECVPASIPTDESDHTVTADLSGLVPGAEYHYRLTAANAHGTATGQDATFLTLGPAVETTGSPIRTATTARLEGRVNPANVATTYHFEYGDQGPCDANPCISTEPLAADSGNLIELVSQAVTGLQPNTTYHYRVVADNGSIGGLAFGEDMAVTTRASDAPLSHGDLAGPAGSDRAWEQVSAPDTGGNPVNTVTAISDNGERVTYNPVGGTPESTTGSLFNQLFAERTPGGWKTSAILPPRVEAQGNNWVEPAGKGDLSELFAVNWSTVSGAEASGWLMRPHAPATEVFSVPLSQWAGFTTVSDDASRVLSTFRGSLDPDHPAGSEAVNLYDVTSGAPHLISLMPGDAVPACGVAPNVLPPAIGAGSIRRAPHWVSADGSLAFFPSYGDNCAPPIAGAQPQLYVRDIEAEETRLISGPPLSGLDCGGVFIKSTPGAAFFWTQSRLAPDDTAPVSCTTSGTPADGDVYRYDLTDNELECVTCVVPGIPATVQIRPAVEVLDVGREIAVAEDGSRVYFRSTQVLVPGAAPTAAGESNAYRVDVANGNLAYVARLDLGAEVGEASAQSNAITADGSVLIFRSADPSLNALNGLDNGGTLQYYRYDDRNRSLICVSCPQDGSPPRGAVRGTPNGHLVEGQQLGPNLTPLDESGDTFIFNTPTPLVSADQNTAGSGQGAYVGTDVYEWRDGRQLLVSDGLTSWPDMPAGEGGPRAAGLSRSGRDAFFMAAAQYTPDALESFDRVYDARIGGGFSFPRAPQPCSLEVCQGTPKGAPEDLLPGTGSFSGPGNVKPHPRRRCRRGKVRRGRHCVAKRHKRSRHGHRHRAANRNRKGAR